MNLAFLESDISILINGILQNEAWTRVLILGAVVYGLVQIRGIKKTMVTREGLKTLFLEREKDMRWWVDKKFLSKAEHQNLCRIVDADISNIKERQREGY